MILDRTSQGLPCCSVCAMRRIGSRSATTGNDAVPE